jgi:hypothetical protein
MNLHFISTSQAFLKSQRISTDLVELSFIKHPCPSPLNVDLSARHICIVKQSLHMSQAIAEITPRIIF